MTGSKELQVKCGGHFSAGDPHICISFCWRSSHLCLFLLEIMTFINISWRILLLTYILLDVSAHPSSCWRLSRLSFLLEIITPVLLPAGDHLACPLCLFPKDHYICFSLWWPSFCRFLTNTLAPPKLNSHRIISISRLPLYSSECKFTDMPLGESCWKEEVKEVGWTPQRQPQEVQFV